MVNSTSKGDLKINSLSTNLGILNNNIKKVELLGGTEVINWERNVSGLIIKGLKLYTSQFEHAYRIICEGYQVQILGGEVAK